MAFNLTINVKATDVTGAGIGVGRMGLTVARQTSSAPVQVAEVILSGALGQPLVVNDVVLARLAISVSSLDYTTERAVLTFDDGKGAWQTTNPHVWPSGPKTDLNVAVRLGVMWFAPVRHIAETTPQKPDFNPRAALIEQRGASFAYRGYWAEDVFVARLSDPIAGDPKAENWDRFQHQKKHWIGRDNGSFALLEFGFPAPNTNGRPRFLVGAWYPNRPLGDVANVGVYFSPNTGVPYPGDSYPFAKAYPYQMIPHPGKKGPGYTLADLHSAYLGLAINYLIDGYKTVYQMLAAQKNHVVLMPIQPAGQWEALATRTGLWRMVLEAVRFGEAQRLITRGGQVDQLTHKPEGTSVDIDKAGLAEQPYDRKQIRVTTSAFSAGLGAMLSLIATAKLQDDKKYPTSHFGASDSECSDAWKGLWDVDGAFHQLGGVKSCMTQMLGWRKLGLQRQLRMYHSEDTVSSTEPVGEILSDVAIKRHQLNGCFVDQGYSPDRSTLWTLFSNTSLVKKSTPPEVGGLWPVFGSQDAHHMVPTIAFGHAWQIS